MFNYNGMMAGGDFIDDLDQGVVSGITPSDFPWGDEPFVPGDPGPMNLVPSPVNSAFGLD